MTHLYMITALMTSLIMKSKNNKYIHLYPRIMYAEGQSRIISKWRELPIVESKLSENYHSSWRFIAFYG